MERYDLAIVGACAAGITAAIQAARHYPERRIILLERLPRIGKKLLATGNGRCNLSNIACDSHCYHAGAFTAPALQRFPPGETLAFFRSLGLLCYQDSAGRIYPMSNTASGVLDTLRAGLERSGVELRCDTPVERVQQTEQGFVINDSIAAEKLILATGGKAAPAQGSNGSGYALLRALDHSVTPLTPALVSLTAPQEQTKALAGLRVHDAVLRDGENRVRGEILFTAGGLSGIAAMDMSRFLERFPCELELDLLPALTQEELREHTLQCAALPVELVLTGLLPKMVGHAVCRAAGITPGQEVGEAQWERICYSAKHFPLQITGTRGFENAQITRGGAALAEFDAETLASRHCPGLYCAGELLDVDGACGGYNLQWAWSSGLLAGLLL